MVLDGKSLQECSVNAGVPQGSILGPTLFLLYINELPDAICNIFTYVDDTIHSLILIRHLIGGNNLELPSELDSDLQESVDWRRKWLVDFNAEKTQLLSFDCSSNTGAIDVKRNGSVLEAKSSFKVLGLGIYIMSIVKSVSKKIGA